MIIECINCNKKFNVEANLIPENGRQIQCGSCDYIWHYKVEIPSEKSLILDDKNIQQDERINYSLLPLSDGLSFIRKK